MIASVQSLCGFFPLVDVVNYSIAFEEFCVFDPSEIGVSDIVVELVFRRYSLRFDDSQ